MQMHFFLFKQCKSIFKDTTQVQLCALMFLYNYVPMKVQLFKETTQ